MSHASARAFTNRATSLRAGIVRLADFVSQLEWAIDL